MKFNLNNTIKIKPTELGLQLMVKRFNTPELPIRFHKSLDSYKKKLDANGFMEIQMHQFLEYFGCLGIMIERYVDININVELNQA